MFPRSAAPDLADVIRRFFVGWNALVFLYGLRPCIIGGQSQFPGPEFAVLPGEIPRAALEVLLGVVGVWLIVSQW